MQSVSERFFESSSQMSKCLSPTPPTHGGVAPCHPPAGPQGDQTRMEGLPGVHPAGTAGRQRRRRHPGVPRRPGGPPPPAHPCQLLTQGFFKGWSGGGGGRGWVNPPPNLGDPFRFSADLPKGLLEFGGSQIWILPYSSRGCFNSD